jgi:phospholipid/cholesterol/gamma-HCH transport system permease protein
MGRMDTAGAWLLDRARQTLTERGVTTDVERLRPEYEILLKEAHFREFEATPPRRGNPLVNFLADIGAAIEGVGRDIYASVAFLGDVVAAFGGLLVRPRGFRITSLVSHIEQFALRSVPIIVLINFLVGAIVAQQGLVQLRQFGAQTFTVNLIGILVLRELAVILTSIMIAGRSGSAITAELGSMKMREEMDALKVMGLSPIEVLILPRLMALIISLPLLTFLADMAALFGGLCVAWGYGGISPEAFIARLQTSISLSTFMIGIVKAPFMALIIGLIASVEGLAVQGSAESLGRQVTASVVKSIFMVIVVDGLFAMFFAGMHY